MIWLYIALAVVLGIPAVMIIVGLLLPERYEIRLTVARNRSPQDVWSALLDYQANPLVGKLRKKSEPLPDVNGLPSWIEDMGSTQIIVVTLESAAPSRLRRKFTDSVVPMTSDSEITLEAADDGCRATATSVIVIKSGTWHVPFFRVMVGLLGGAKMGLKDYWRRLAANVKATARFE